MWIVKLGGSLRDSDALARWLEVLADSGGGRVVIVPGGGGFADQVREAQRRWGFGDAAAHRMALLAMEQFGLMLGAIRSGFALADTAQALREALTRGAVPIWLPARMAAGTVPATWDVTSDSLAAWLATRLAATRLVLVKSCPVQPDLVSAPELSELGIVDRAFPEFVRTGSFEISVLGRDDYSCMAAWLQRGKNFERAPVARGPS